MSEIKTEVKTFRVSFICEECGRGEMVPTGVCLLSYPPQYPHVCTVCGAEETFFKQYPALVNETGT